MSVAGSLIVAERSRRFERSFFVFVLKRSGVSGSVERNSGAWTMRAVSIFGGAACMAGGGGGGAGAGAGGGASGAACSALGVTAGGSMLGAGAGASELGG